MANTLLFGVLASLYLFTRRMIDPKSKLPRYYFALCALFTSILNNRLYDYMVQKGILKAEQGGFRKMHGTVDSILTLKMLIDKYVKSKPQKHGNASLTLKKPSTVYPKLRKEGLQGRFLDVLISMYPVKIDDNLSQSYTCKEKDACCHLLFLISIGRTTHVTRDMCFPGREKHITTDMCCAGIGENL